MKRILSRSFSLCTVSFCLLFVSSAAAQKRTGYPRTLYVTFAGAPVYDSARYSSNVAGTLRLGDSVTATAGVGKFFRIILDGREGYILGANVSQRKPAVKPKPAADGGAKPARDASSSRATSHPDAESRQCAAVTKSGKRCSRATSDSSGYCWQHKKSAP